MHHLIAVMGMSERFACRVTGQHRTTQRHQAAETTPVDPDAVLGSGCGTTPRPTPGERLWREEGLRVPQHRRHKRVGFSTAPDGARADAPNQVWAVDYQFDSTTDSRPVKIVSIVEHKPASQRHITPTERPRWHESGLMKPGPIRGVPSHHRRRLPTRRRAASTHRPPRRRPSTLNGASQGITGGQLFASQGG